MPLFRRIQILEIPRRYIARITTLRFPHFGASRRDVGLRAIWEEAKINMITQLRLGVHPVLLQQEVDSDGYPYLYRHQIDVDDLSSKILANFRRAGQFDDMPSLGEYERGMDDDVWLARFEVKMYEKFGQRDLVNQFGMDPQISRKIDRARELTRDERDWLAIIKDTKNQEVEEKYEVNQEILHRARNFEERPRPRRPRSVSTTIHNPRTRNHRNDRNRHSSAEIPNDQHRRHAELAQTSRSYSRTPSHDRSRHSAEIPTRQPSRSASRAMYSDSGLLSETSHEFSAPRGRERQPRSRRHSMMSNLGLYHSSNQRGRPPASRPYLFDGIDDMVFGNGNARRYSTPVAEDWHWDEPLEDEIGRGEV